MLPRLNKSGYLHLAGYGIALALGAFALNLLEYRLIARTYSGEITALLIAVCFLALGVWIGIGLTPAPAETGFQKNTAAINAFGITRSEYVVLELLATGHSNKGIARALGVAPNTVKSHLSSLFSKLKVQRRTQAVAQARSFGLIA